MASENNNLPYHSCLFILIEFINVSCFENYRSVVIDDKDIDAYSPDYDHDHDDDNDDEMSIIDDHVVLLDEEEARLR